MKKFTLFVAAMFFIFGSIVANAQTSREVVYSDDFESYTAGAHIAQSIPDRWTTWSNAPGTAEDGVFSADQASSGTLSAMLSGTNDNVMKLGNKTSGFYEISWKHFVPTGFAGYFNIQHFEAPGNEWACEIYLDDNGTGLMHAGGANAATFNYPYNQWFDVKFEIDLDADLAKFYINAALVHEWQFSLQAQGQAGTKQLGAVNFYAGASTGMTPKYYIDDVEYSKVTQQFIYQDNFDSYTAGAYVAVTIPQYWTTWSNAPGTNEDAQFSAEVAQTAPLSVKVEGTTTDLLLKLGNKTSGKYQVSWDMFVPTGKAGYFNFQHMEAPGNEWAVEVYFDNNGTGYMHAGGDNAATFNYPMNAWYHIDNVIDLDNDWAEFYINNALVHGWQFSLQAQGQAGTKQLGCVDFYAGATSGMTPTYYFDNVSYAVLVEGSQDPTIGVNTSAIITTVEQGATYSQVLPITNIGEGTLNFEIVRSFEAPTAADAPSGLVPSGTVGKIAPDFAVDPTPFRGEPAPSNRDVTLHYDGENYTGIGLTNGGQWRAAVRFPASMMTQYQGMYLSSVEVYINESGNGHKLQVYDMGSFNVPGPGTMLREQVFDPLPGWNTLNLVNPVFISGKELWVGYWVDQPAGVYVVGADAGPAIDDGRWISTGPGWNYLSLDYNWNIRAVLTGTAEPVWLTATPSSGSLTAGQSSDITVAINATGLPAPVVRKAKLNIRSNDFANELVSINVWITVLVGLDENGQQAYVSMYPNPALNNINLKSNININRISISNSLGQVIYSATVDQKETKLDISHFKAGMYYVSIETDNGTATQKLMVD